MAALRRPPLREPTPRKDYWLTFKVVGKLVSTINLFWLGGLYVVRHASSFFSAPRNRRVTYSNHDAKIRRFLSFIKDKIIASQQISSIKEYSVKVRIGIKECSTDTFIPLKVSESRCFSEINVILFKI